PQHPIIANVIANDYLSMYKWELEERKKFNYPPFCRLIAFTLRHKDIDLLNEGALHFGKLLRGKFCDRVLGPEFPLVARIRSLYNKKLLLKIEKEASVSAVKKEVHGIMSDFAQRPYFKTIRILADVNPV